MRTYTDELNTPVEHPLARHWYAMRVGQLIQHYIAEGCQKVDFYMSFTYGAAYGYPEARLADLILPDATSLERWDTHSQNCHELSPYTGIRQPLVKSLGEARPVQLMLRDWAHLIGGDMPQHFDFESSTEGLEGVHPRVIACAHHAGHWEHGSVAKAEAADPDSGSDAKILGDHDLPGGIWWSKARGDRAGACMSTTRSR